MKIVLPVSILLIFLFHSTNAEVIEFVESFRGTGGYSLEDGRLPGFDNPGWNLFGGCGADGVCAVFSQNVVFTPNGLHFENAGNSYGEFDILTRFVSGSGSFIERVEVTDLQLPPICDMCLGSGGIAFGHFTGNFSIDEFDSNPRDWAVHTRHGRTTIESGPDLMIQLRYNADTGKLNIFLDTNLADDSRPFNLGTFTYESQGESDRRTEFTIGAQDAGNAHGTLTHWSIRNFSGDFNQDNHTDVADVTLLNESIAARNDDQTFDLDSDRKVDGYDRDIWVHELANTHYGDANLDGHFNSADLVQVFIRDKFEDDITSNSTWASGDWNGDGEFDSRDLIVAFEDGGYSFDQQTFVAVPELTAVHIFVSALLLRFRFNTRETSITLFSHASG